MVKCFSAFLAIFKCTKTTEEVIDWQHTYVTTPDTHPVEQAPSVVAGQDLVTDVSTNNTFEETPPDVVVTVPVDDPISDNTTPPAEPVEPVTEPQEIPPLGETSTQVEHHAGMPTASQVRLRATVQSRGLRRA